MFCMPSFVLQAFHQYVSFLAPFRCDNPLAPFRLHADLVYVCAMTVCVLLRVLIVCRLCMCAQCIVCGCSCIVCGWLCYG